MKGIYVSSGSACSCKSVKVPQIIMAMNKTKDSAFCSIRFSLDKENTIEELNYVFKILEKEIHNNRKNIN